MVKVTPVEISGRTVIGIEVELPKTYLTMLATRTGYIMCGALDVKLLNERLAHRGIIAGRAVGVRTLEELLAAPLESVTTRAEELGIVPGMTGAEALAKMPK